jgi:selenide,water dikinase
VLRHVPASTDPHVLVGATLADDAAVYQVAQNLALVATVDYITPVVDDPFAWGEIAAANALSDVYAMGAQPIFALNVVNFPRDTLPLETLERVIQGGASKVAEAGIPILGGHSVDDPEPKYGLVALGTVDPARVMCNVGAQPGDVLLLTKPLGMGMITTAIKRGLASNEIIAQAIGVMSALNRAASEAMLASDGVHAATDVTGFGLLGHLGEMLGRGDVGAQVDADAVPVLDAAWDFVRQDIVPGGTRRNLASVETFVDWSERLTPQHHLVLADAQTSGGLLLAVAPAAVEALLVDLHRRGVSAATRIGRFTDQVGRIKIV